MKISSRRKNPWCQYMIGNPLRGHIYFKARSIVEAWSVGRRKFNACWPPNSPTSGRIITLSVRDDTPILTTKWMVDEAKLPPKKRQYSNHELPTRGWVAIACGGSNEELILENPNPAPR